MHTATATDTHTCAHTENTHTHLCYAMLPLIQVHIQNIYTSAHCRTFHTSKHLYTLLSTSHPTSTHSAHTCARTTVPTFMCKHTHTNTPLICAYPQPALLTHTLLTPRCTPSTHIHTPLHIQSGTPPLSSVCTPTHVCTHTMNTHISKHHECTPVHTHSSTSTAHVCTHPPLHTSPPQGSHLCMHTLPLPPPILFTPVYLQDIPQEQMKF